MSLYLEFKFFKLKFLDLIGKIRGFTMPISCGCYLQFKVNTTGSVGPVCNRQIMYHAFSVLLILDYGRIGFEKSAHANTELGDDGHFVNV